MNRTDEKYIEDMIVLTAYPEWDVLVKDLEAVIYHMQANAFEATDWDQLQQDKGFAKGLAYFINMRDTMKKLKENADATV